MSLFPSVCSAQVNWDWTNMKKVNGLCVCVCACDGGMVVIRHGDPGGG